MHLVRKWDRYIRIGLRQIQYEPNSTEAARHHPGDPLAPFESIRVRCLRKPSAFGRNLKGLVWQSFVEDMFVENAASFGIEFL